MNRLSHTILTFVCHCALRACVVRSFIPTYDCDMWKRTFFTCTPFNVHAYPSFWSPLLGPSKFALHSFAASASSIYLLLQQTISYRYSLTTPHLVRLLIFPIIIMNAFFCPFFLFFYFIFVFFLFICEIGTCAFLLLKEFHKRILWLVDKTSVRALGHGVEPNRDGMPAAHTYTNKLVCTH